MEKEKNAYKEFTSKDNLINLIDLICKDNNFEHTNMETVKNIIIFLKNLDGQFLLKKYKRIDLANQAIVSMYKDRLTKNASLADNLDEIHTYLTKAIRQPGNESTMRKGVYKDTFEPSPTVDTIVSLFNKSSEKDKIELVKYINYESTWRSTYIIVDSRYQNTVNNDSSKILFNLQTTSKVRADHGGVVVGNAIRDIVEVEVYPFTIPYKPVFANFYKRITLTIEEWTADSFEAYENGAFHFVFDIDKIDENLIHLIPVNKTFRFTKPVNYIDNFTLSFGAMLPKIQFDLDRMYPSSIDFSAEDGIFTFSYPHNLVTGDLVYITGFSSPDPAQDGAVIAEVNRDAGHTIVKKNNYSIIINVDLSSMYREVPTGSGIYPITSFEQTPLIYFASKRIQIPMRISYLLAPRVETTTS